MIRKWIIWFLVLAILNLIILPSYVIAGEPVMPHIDVSPSLDSAAVIGGVVILVLVIAGIAYLIKKHTSKATKQPQDPNTTISPVTNLNNQHITPSDEISLFPQEQKQITEVSPHTDLDKQLITPSGEIVLLQW